MSFCSVCRRNKRAEHGVGGLGGWGLEGWGGGEGACSTAESFGVSAQIGSAVVRGGPEEGSTPPEFHQGSIRFCEGCGVVRELKRAPHAVGDVT